MNDQQWYYESNGQQAGPVSWNDLMAGLKSGTIFNDTCVWAAHLSEWTPLSQCIEFQGNTISHAATKGVCPPVQSKIKMKTLCIWGALILLLIGSAFAGPALLSQGKKATASGSGQAVLESDILQTIRMINSYSGAIKMAATASNAHQNTSYIMGNAASRSQAINRLRGLIQSYEMQFGRDSLLKFVQANEIQGALSI